MNAIRAAILACDYDLERCEFAAGKPLNEISRTVRVGPTEGLRTGSIAVESCGRLSYFQRGRLHRKGVESMVLTGTA